MLNQGFIGYITGRDRRQNNRQYLQESSSKKKTSTEPIGMNRLNGLELMMKLNTVKSRGY